MKRISPPSFSHSRIFCACLLAFLTLTAPIAPIGAATLGTTAPRAIVKKATNQEAATAHSQPNVIERFAAFLFGPPVPPAAPVITATMTDAYPAHPSGKAEPGDTITYTANVSNATGTADATAVMFDVSLDANTTYVPGSLKVSPLAFPDAYSVLQGATLSTPALTGVLTNDTGTPTPTAVPIAGGATTQTGTVTLNADGSFTYNPPNAGFTGTDTFTYTATNGQAPPNATDAQAIVTITVNPPNQAPVANNDSASASEAGGTANGTSGTNPSGNLVTGGSPGLVADTDAEDPSSALTVVAVRLGPEATPGASGIVGSPLAGSYGSLALNSNGSYTYTVDNNNATVQALRTSGDTVQDIFNYTIQDTGPGTPLQDTAQFTVTISGANDAPTDIAITASSVAENAATNTVVGDFSTTDIDSGDTFTYTLVVGTGSTDNGSFNISGNQLRTSAAFNFEISPSLSIRVRSTDAGGLFFEKVFTIMVTNVNEAPTDIALSSSTVGENMPINTVIGNFSTTDPDAGDTFTYSLVTGAGDTDNGSFNINGNQLRTSAMFDFETKSSYSIRVRSTDAGTLNFEKVFTITVLNNNDAPTDIALSNSSVAENSAINTVVGNFSTTDVDAGDTFTYTLVAGVGDTDNASFNINGAQLRTSAMFDFETKSSYTIRVRSTDSGAAFFEKQFTITVTNVNEAPVLTTSGGSASFTEDGPGVAVDTGITVADVDTTTLASGTIQITGNLQTAQDVLAFTNDGSTMGNIAVSVAYNSATGLLTLASAGNTATLLEWQNALRAVTYNNTSQNPNTTARTVSFRVNDGALNSNIATKGVTVTGVNDAPVLAAIEGVALPYTENDAPTSITASMTVADVDSTTLTTATISITGNYQSSQDVLSFTNGGGMGNIAVQSNTGGVLTLTSAGGTATLLEWQTALRAVKYNNSSNDPNTSTRTVVFQVNDGGAVNNLSNTQQRNITVTAVNDPPTPANVNVNGLSGVPVSYPAGTLSGTDLEAGTTVTIDTVAGTSSLVNLVSATVNVDGSFTIVPVAGALGASAASFQYKVKDNGNPGPGVSSTAFGTVTINLNGSATYYVKSAAVGLGNCTRGSECLLATAVTNIGAATNKRIFISDAATQSTTAVPLNSDGWLIGQGVTGSDFAAVMGYTAAVTALPGGATLPFALPAINQTRPTIGGTTTLHNNSNVRGLNVSVSGANKGLVAASRTGLVVNDITTITAVNNTAVDFSSSSGTFAFNNIVTNTGSGAGAIFASTTSGSTVTFNNITTASGAAFTASSTGATDFTFNDVTSTTGQAVGVTTSTGDFIFHAINANGAPTGIGVTSATGSFTVNGTGTTLGSGGTIQNITNRGASFITVNNITLKNMNFTNVGTVNGADPTTPNSTCGALETGLGGNLGCNAGLHLVTTVGVTLDRVVLNGGVQQGINGNSVTNLVMSNSSVLNFGNETREDGLRIKNLLGNSSMTSTTVTGNEEHQIRVVNVSGTLTTFNVTGSTFSNSVCCNGGDGIQFEAKETAVMNMNVQSSTMSNNAADGFFATATDTASINVTVQGSTMNGNVNAGVNIGIVSNSNGKFTVGGAGALGNNINGGSTELGNYININLGAPSTGTLQGTVSGNTIVGSTAVGSGGTGIRIVSNGSGTLTAAVTNNTVTNPKGEGINVLARDGSSTLNATITGNNVTLDPTTDQHVVTAVSGAVGTDTTNVCADIGGAGALANTLNDGNPPNSDAIRVRNRFSGTLLRLPGYAGGGTDTAAVIAYLQGRNNETGDVTATLNLNSFGGGAACTQPVAALRQPAEYDRRNTYARGSGSSVAPVRVVSRAAKLAPAGTRLFASEAKVVSNQARLASSEAKAVSGLPNTVRLVSHHARSRTKVALSSGEKLGSAAGTPRRSQSQVLSHHVVSKRKAPVAQALTTTSSLLASAPPFPISIGTIPAGKSVRITFQVTLNSLVPPSTSQVSAQGTVSGANFSNVFTDDTGIGANAGETDPTVTPVIGPPIANDDPGYTAFKNTPLNVSIPGVLGNDSLNTGAIASYGVLGTEQTAIGNPTPTAQGGTISLNADGSFSYTPASAFTGADTFVYQLTNAAVGGTDTASVTITVADTSAVYINEVVLNPPGTDAPNEYIELRGTVNAAIPAGTYLVASEGDSADNPGDVQTIINLSGLSFGSNGFLVLLQQGNTYTTAAGATVITSTTTGFGGLPGGIWSADSAATDIEDASVTFMIVQTGVAPTLTDDIDSNDDGTPDGGAYAGWGIRDSIGVLDGTSVSDRAYGSINYSNNSGTNGSATGTTVLVSFIAGYVGRRGDTTGSTASDWVASANLGGSLSTFTLGAASETEPSSFAGKPLNHIGASNFANVAPVNAVPGAQSTNEDVPFVFTGGTQISISDSDAGTASVQVKLTATGGTMSLSGTSGLTFVPPSGSNDGVNDTDMTFTGTLTDINTALSNLSFTPTLNSFSPPLASIAIETNDLGNTGVGGNQTDTDTVNITINPINDPPSFVKGADQTIVIDAGPQTVPGWATAISQGPGESGQTPLTFNVVAQGGATVTFLSPPAIDATTGNLTYTANVGSSGTATFDVTLSDSGASAPPPNSNSSGVQSFTITVVPMVALTVNSTGDEADANLGDRICDADLGTGGDQCTLRAAVQETNAASTPDTIGFSLAANSTIVLTSALDDISGDLAITGPASGVTISGNNLYRVFSVQAGKTVGIASLTIANGQSSQGGGIFNLGNLTITNSALTGNKAVGSEGGGIYSSSGTLTIINSTISGNTSDGVGGGLANAGTSTASLTNVTITNNRADADGNAAGNGGGIHESSSNSVTLRNVIVAGNFVGLSPGTTADDISGTVAAASNNNLIGTGGSGGLTNGVNNNQVGVVDARLGVLANNGGPTQTHALLSGSVALDAGDDSVIGAPLSLTTDQRGTGFARQADGPDANTTDKVDIGALEAEPSVEDISDKSTNENVALPPFNFNIGDASVLIVNITATSDNQTLVPNGNIFVLLDTASTRTLSITPAANQFGTATITVTVTRGTQSMSDTFLLTVNSVNDPPSFTKGPDQTVAEDSGPQSVSGWATTISPGPNESSQTVNFVVQNNTNPSLFSAGPAISPTGTLNYTPAPNANGTATITIVLMDNGGGTDTSAPQEFVITVAEVNDTPDAVNDGLSSVAEDSGMRTISIASLLTNDNAGPANESGQTLTFSLVAASEVGGTISSDATNVYFTPTTNYSGPASFQYQITDNGTTNGIADPKNDTATVSFTITAVNDPPSFVKGPNQSVAEDAGPQSVPSWATSISPGSGESGQTLTFLVQGNTNPGLFSAGPAISPTGTLTYTPAANANGSATITIALMDNGGGTDTSASQQFVITVTEVNDAPDAVDDGLSSVAEDSGMRTISIASLLGNDNSGPANESGQTLTLTLVPGSAVGGTISSDATNVYFTPTTNYSGPASFQYQITDNGTTNGAADPKNDTATVSFTITGGNDAPTAVNDTLPDIPENSGPRLILASTLTANDSKGGPDEIGQTLTIKTVINVEGGTVAIVDGNIVFTPTANYHGPAIFSYTVEDSGTTNGSPDPKTSNQAVVQFNITAIGSGGVLRFSSDNYSVAEGAGLKTITVERSGNTSQAVTVDYASSDHSSPADSVPCTSPGAGFASSRCDFTTAIGTLRFAAGETLKTFKVLITNDNYVEGPETLELSLSNPTNGAVFGVPQNAILQITDDAAEPATNPIDNSAAFVTAQYHDILNREPDAGGLAFWTDNIEKCNDPARIPAGQTVPQCIDKQRESTAIAFFMSPEFQMTGGYVYNLYKGSLTGSPNYDGGSAGRFPTFLEFIHDMSQVSEGIVVNGQISGAVVEANRNALAAAFVARPEFVAKYGGLDNTLFVDELFNTTGITPTAAEKQALVDGLTGGESRASVLRKVVDGTVVIDESNVQFTTTYGQAFINQENRRLFVFLEYIGYLRRNPDPAGFVFWLGKLNFYNGDPFQAEMVRAFILSPEYRNRFGQP